MNPGNYVALTDNGVRWIGREWQDDARQLQQRGFTLSEISELLSLRREAVVKALYTDVVKPKASDA